QLTGRSPSLGALAGIVAESSAEILSRVVFGKSPNELTEGEKQQVVALSQVASALATVAGGNGETAASAMASAKSAVENNYLSAKNVQNLFNDIQKAIKEGKSVDEVYDVYKQLSETQRQELLADCDALCRLTVKTVINQATEVAELKSGMISGWLSGLSSQERSRFLELVETENAQTVSEINARQGTFEKTLELGVELAQTFGHKDGNSKPKQNSLYDPKKTRAKIEGEAGKEKVKSTTVVSNPRSTVTNRVLKTGEQVSITESEGGKAVKVYSKPDKDGNRKEIANIPYDKRGLPIFDDVAPFTTKIEKPKGYENMSSEKRRKVEMRNATLSLKEAINKGQVNKNQFTKKQLEDINQGKVSIDGFTWHHNAQSAPNNMQLVPRNLHKAVEHIGEGSLSEGR
ncbi:HNH endonuclease, partial [Muribacter muris]